MHLLQMTKLSLFWVAVLCIAPPSAPPQSLSFNDPPHPGVDRRLEEDNVREAVFRYRVEREKLRPVFLSI
jgi:hypothetical protein